MIRAWRLARRLYSDPPATLAFDGRGSELFGNRWNPVGLPAAYASPHRALAALEYLVHVDRSLVPADLVFSEAEFEDMDVEVAVPPADWDIVGSPSAIVYGERWLREQRSLVLAYRPSSYVPKRILSSIRGIHDFHRWSSHLHLSHLYTTTACCARDARKKWNLILIAARQTPEGKTSVDY